MLIVLFRIRIAMLRNEFLNYLEKNKNIRLKYVKFFLIWVEKACKINDLSFGDFISTKQKKEFIASISDSCQKWQLLQADKAIEYYQHFLNKTKKENSPSASIMPHPEIETYLEKTSNAIRVRKFALNTEKIYLHWLKSYFYFAGIKKVSEFDSELLGHANVQTTMIYTHIAKRNILGVRSPLDD